MTSQMVDGAQGRLGAGGSTSSAMRQAEMSAAQVRAELHSEDTTEERRAVLWSEVSRRLVAQLRGRA